MSRIPDAQQAFTVLGLAPAERPSSPDAIRSACAGIPGVGALHVDADRGKLHVLYDGSPSTIEQLAHALAALQQDLRRAGPQTPPTPRAPHGRDFP